MKKKKIFILLILSVAFVTGCFGRENKTIEKKLKKQIENSKSYYLKGNLEIINNDDKYTYDVSVSYKEGDYYRVSLKNKTNEHEQIILKNNNGVFVLTPSLKKSFKFQSEWPYNNSQSYILQTLISDIESDKSRKTEKTKNGYIITTKVNYSNNKKFTQQKIYLNKKAIITKVEVIDDENNIKIRMIFNSIDFKKKFSNTYFKEENNIKSSKIESTLNEIEDTIYPMYMPKNTYLSSEDKISLKNGERVILTFLGDKPFTIIEETVNIGKEIETTDVYGEPTMLVDTIGSLNEKDVMWISNGVEYYATSESMNKTELLDVVKSISIMPVGK